MNAERDIAGVALPFAIGVIATAIPQGYPSILLYTLGILSSAAVIITLAVLFSGKHPSRILIGLSSLSCGIVVGITHQAAWAETFSIVPEWAEELCQGLKSHIMSMGFEDSQTKSIIIALLTGDKGALSNETIVAFRSSGAAHILALSGFHLGIIYALISRSLHILGNSVNSKRIRSTLIIIFCGIYTAATGAGPSISRAFLFILIGEIAAITGRYRSTTTVMMSSLMIQLLFSPGSARSVGFQLSYAAMAGIAFIFPWLKRLWPDNEHGPLKWIWTSASMSIACQITTGPLVYLYFGTFARHFLLTNLLTLPLASMVIPLSLITICLDMAEICPEFMLTLTERCVGWMMKIISTIASI